MVILKLQKVYFLDIKILAKSITKSDLKEVIVQLVDKVKWNEFSNIFLDFACSTTADDKRDLENAITNLQPKVVCVSTFNLLKDTIEMMLTKRQSIFTIAL